MSFFISGSISGSSNVGDSAEWARIHRMHYAASTEISSSYIPASEQEFINYTKQLGRHTAQEVIDQNKKNELPGDNIQSKVMTFPKHLSYEGSVVLCVLLSMQEIASVHVSNLPIADQTLIRSLLPKDIKIISDTFKVSFDNRKDFILNFKSTPVYTEDVVLTMFNSVAHPRPEDLTGVGVVPVDKDGDKIEVGGGKIVLNKKGIKKLIGVEPLKKNIPMAADPDIPVDEFPRSRQPVSGRNAFEIRADILQLSMDYMMYNKSELSVDEVLNIAKKFYSFVEKR